MKFETVKTVKSSYIFSVTYGLIRRLLKTKNYFVTVFLPFSFYFTQRVNIIKNTDWKQEETFPSASKQHKFF